MNSVALCSSSSSNNSDGNSSNIVLVLAIAASQKVLLLRALQLCQNRESERRQKEIETHTEGKEAVHPTMH